MTILIKGMEMPKKGYKDIRIHADGSWTAYAETVPYNDIYGAAVEVPTPHGRLIDADAIFEQWYQLNFDRKISDGTLAYWNVLLDKAPTVIEAEEANNGR